MPDPHRGAAGRPISDRQIRDGLVVHALAASASHRPIAATRSSAGAYAFHSLPGLHSAEYPDERVVPVESRDYVVTVEDRLGRYLPVAFGLKLPLGYRGLFVDGGLTSSGSPPSPPDGTGPGAYLFSAPSRSVPPNMAPVRADLLDATTGRPAGHAVLEIEIGGLRSFGLADDQGRVLVLLPFPVVDRLRWTSPPTSPPGAVTSQGWQVTASVRYEPSALSRALIDNEDVGESWRALPSLGSIMRQSQGSIERAVASPPVLEGSITEELLFGKELELRSIDPASVSPLPQLLIHPA